VFIHLLKEMKYAVMSDVHSNPRALEAALADARGVGSSSSWAT